MCLSTAGELHIWSDVIPADLPGPNDDIDALNGVVPGKGGAGEEDPSLMGECCPTLQTAWLGWAAILLLKQ